MCASRRSSLGLRAVSTLLALASVVSGGWLRAEFAEPVRLTDGSGAATQAELAFDVANNAYIVSVVNEQIRVDLVGPNLRVTVDVPGEGVGQGEPSVVTGAVGEAYIAFTQVDEDPRGLGRDIFLTHNGGGSFVEPLQVSDSRLDEFAPSLALDGEGDAHVVWARTVGESDATVLVYRDPETEETTQIAEGGYPSLWVDSQNTAHVVYERDNDLFYVNNAEGEFGEEVRIVNTPSEPEFEARLSGTTSGVLLVTYNSQGSLYLVTKNPSQDFRTPRLVEAGGVLDPESRLRASGALSLVYAKNGDIFVRKGLPTVLRDAEPVVVDTESVESHPTHRVDPCGITHVAFLRDGDVWYSNDAGEIEAQFAANRTSGEVPLLVHFQDLSSGKIQAWRWDFGDGTQATTQSPSHVYDEPGQYTVRLTVFTADRESVMELEQFITVQEPFNTMEIPDARVRQGDTGVFLPVKAGHRDPVMAFQVHAVFDSNLLSLEDCTRESTAVAGLLPEVWECNVFERSVELGCIFDFAPPFDGRVLVPGQNQTLVNLIFNVADTAPAGSVTEIELINNREVSQIFNIFTVDNRSKLPVLEGSTVEIVSRDTDEVPFVRGDIDRSGSVDITDGISLLNFLFTGGSEPWCFDAADVSDTGTVDISGAIYILNFLFLGGASPAPPYPNPGLDTYLTDEWECE